MKKDTIKNIMIGMLLFAVIILLYALYGRLGECWISIDGPVWWFDMVVQ